MIPRSLRFRAPLLWLLLPLMAGLILAKACPGLPSVGWLLALAGVTAFLAWIFRQQSLIALIGLCSTMMIAGAAYYELRRARLPEWDKLPPREAHLTLRVDRIFTPGPDGKRISGLARIEQADTHLTDLVGQRVYFSLAPQKGKPLPIRSARIETLGVLQTLPPAPEFASFEGYLVGSGTNFKLTRGRILAETEKADAYHRFCQRALERFDSILGCGLEKQPDLAGVLKAMMLGRTAELSEAQNLAYRQSGTMHLFSISGLHIAVIALGLQSILGLFRLPRAVQFIAGILILWLYVDITGASPSAVRAFAMIALLQSAQVLRLPVNPLATLTGAALLTLVLDPMQLFSASFQMSYGIVAALLLLGSPLAEFWKEKWRLFRDLPEATWSRGQHVVATIHQWTLSTLAIGLAASLVSTVTGVIFFGLFTPGALLANLVLIPASSLVILSGFLSLLSGLVGLTAASSLFNHAGALLLLIMDRGIEGFLKLPGVFGQAHFVAAWAGFVTLGILLASLLHGYAQRWETKRGGFWAPFVVTVLALVLSMKFG